jgi:hypothetical protein
VFNNPLKYTDPSGHCSSDPANDHDGRCEQRTDDSAAWILGLPGDVDDTLTDAWFASHPNYNPAKDDIESWAEATGHIPGTSRFILSAAYLRWSIANGTDEQAGLGIYIAMAASAGVPQNMGPQGASLNDVSAARSGLGLPPRSSNTDPTGAVMNADGKQYVGQSGRKPIAMPKINATSKDHAEIDTLNQLYLERQASGVTGGSASMAVDLKPCKACWEKGGIRNAVRATGLDELHITYPGGNVTITR